MQRLHPKAQAKGEVMAETTSKSSVLTDQLVLSWGLAKLRSALLADPELQAAGLQASDLVASDVPHITTFVDADQMKLIVTRTRET